MTLSLEEIKFCHVTAQDILQLGLYSKRSGVPLCASELTRILERCYKDVGEVVKKEMSKYTRRLVAEHMKVEADNTLATKIIIRDQKVQPEVKEIITEYKEKRKKLRITATSRKGAVASAVAEYLEENICALMLEVEQQLRAISYELCSVKVDNPEDTYLHEFGEDTAFTIKVRSTLR